MNVSYNVVDVSKLLTKRLSLTHGLHAETELLARAKGDIGDERKKQRGSVGGEFDSLTQLLPSIHFCDIPRGIDSIGVSIVRTLLAVFAASVCSLSPL